MRRAIQHLVRRAPNMARFGWALVPERVKLWLAPWVHPIAAGQRGSAWTLQVPRSHHRPPVAYVGPHLGPDEPAAIYRSLGAADEAVCACPAEDPRVDSLERYGFRVVDALPETESEARRLFPEVSVVIPTLERPELLAACLDSLASTTAWPRLEVIVVDNGGMAATKRVVERERGMAIRLLSMGENAGFARGVNAGVRAAAGDVILLLNDDTVMAPGCIARLVAHLEADSELGLVCPVTNDVGNEAKVSVDYDDFASMVRFSRRRTVEHLGCLRQTDVVPLFCAGVRASVLRECGGLDERYEIGMFEDDDICRTLRERGYRLGIAEDCFVHHVGQGTFSRLSDERYLAIWEANKARFEDKWRVTWRPPR